MARKLSFFAGRLKELRQQSGLTQEQLARKANLSVSAVRHFEQGLKEPTYATLLKLAEALGVSLAAFEPEQRKGKPK
jgi:transcriptional regulator with XRE-family HTH domain